VFAEGDGLVHQTQRLAHFPVLLEETLPTLHLGFSGLDHLGKAPAPSARCIRKRE
jgi:hypothetical protein